MKKFYALLLSLILVLPLTACGGKSSEAALYGTWKVANVEYEGTKFTSEEWKNMDNEDYTEFFIIIKEGGQAYVYDYGYGDLVDWLVSEDSIMIGEQKCNLVDDQICFEYYSDELVYLNKVSDSQIIPSDKNVQEETEDIDTEEDVEESRQPAASNENSADDAEWKQFLEDYEAWVDDYIEIVKKYKENPTDISILSDYTEMVSDMADWSERANEVQKELENSPTATVEYAAELARIAAKLAEAAY